VKLQERRVNNLVEESCLASSRGEFQLVRLSVCLSLCMCLSLIDDDDDDDYYYYYHYDVDGDGDVVVWKALEKAKEAGRLEKNLRQSRERTVTGSPGSPADQPNFDLTYSVSNLT